MNVSYRFISGRNIEKFPFKIEMDQQIPSQLHFGPKFHKFDHQTFCLGKIINASFRWCEEIQILMVKTLKLNLLNKNMKSFLRICSRKWWSTQKISENFISFSRKEANFRKVWKKWQMNYSNEWPFPHSWNELFKQISLK